MENSLGYPIPDEPRAYCSRCDISHDSVEFTCDHEQLCRWCRKYSECERCQIDDDDLSILKCPEHQNQGGFYARGNQ